MAAARKSAAKAAKAAGTNPYIQRLAQDAELRENVREAFELSRKAYSRLANGKAPTKALMEDKKLQRELREAAISLRDVGNSLKEGPKKRKRKGGLGRKLMLGLVGAGIALAVSEGLRKKVLDTLFGAEEEFDYTSTSSPSPTPETAAA